VTATRPLHGGIVVFIVALRLPDAIYRNICRSAFEWIRTRICTAAAATLLNYVPCWLLPGPGSPGFPGYDSRSPDTAPHRFTSTTLADFLNELSSPLSYEINDFSANFQQFAFWPRPGTKMGMAKGACKQQIESENFL